MEKLSEKRKRQMFMLITFIVSAILFYGMEMGRGIGINADETTNYYIGKDLFQGNFFLKGWYFSTGMFLLPTYELTILTKLFGYHDGIIYAISSANYALFVTLSLYAIYRAGERYKIKNRLIYVLFAALIVFIPRAEMIYNCGTHVLCIAVSIAVFFLFYKLQNMEMKLQGRAVLMVLLSVVMGYLSVTNTMFMFSALYPLILSGVCISVQQRDIKTGLHYIVPGVCSVVSHVVWKNVFLSARDGVNLGSSSTVFVNKDDLWASFCESIYGTLQLFKIDIWNKEMFSKETLEAVLGCIVLCKLVFELIKFFANKKDKYAIFVYMFLISRGFNSPQLAATRILPSKARLGLIPRSLLRGSLLLALVNFCSYMFSKMALTYRSTHLIFPILFGMITAGTIAWVMNIYNQASSGEWRQYVAVAVVLFFMMLPDISFKQPEAYMSKVAEYLTENGYVSGYGGFWSATTAMYYAGGFGNENMEIIPVQKSDNGRLCILKWLTKDERISHQANFLVCDKHDFNQFGLTDDAISNTFGRWSRKLEFDGGILLYLWDGRISTCGLWGSNSYNEQMSLSDSEMLKPDGSIVIKPSDILYGPYVNLEDGNYNLIVEAEGVKDQKIKITADCGEILVAAFDLIDGNNFITFHLKEDAQNIEFVIDGTEASAQDLLTIKNIFLARSDNCNMLPAAEVSEGASIAGDGKVCIGPGQKLNGPDINLQKGKYRIALETDTVSGNTLLAVTVGHAVLNTYQLAGEDDIFYIDLKEFTKDISFLIRNMGESDTFIKSISFQKVYSLELLEQMSEINNEWVSPGFGLNAGTYRIITKCGQKLDSVKEVVTDENGNVLSQTDSFQKGENSMLFTVDENANIQVRFSKNISKIKLSSITVAPVNFVEYLSKMQLSSDSMRQKDGSVLISGGNMIFGPYINMKEGWHCLKVNVKEAPEGAEVIVRKGLEDVAIYSLGIGENIFDLYMENQMVNGKKSKAISSVEFIIRNPCDVPIHINDLLFE